eukprot:4524888-Ditylum_brightwellii.AAC.2
MSLAAMNGALHRMVVLNFWTVWNKASSGSVVHVLFMAWNHVIKAGPDIDMEQAISKSIHLAVVP